MSDVRNPDQIIIIDDDVGAGIGQSKNMKFEKSNETSLRRNLEIKAQQSNAQKSDSIVPDSNVQKEELSNLTHTFTVMLGALYGKSSEDVNKMMESEKGLTTELHNAIETLSNIFKDSSLNEIPETPQNGKKVINSSRNLEIPSISFDISTNRDLPVNNVFNVPINKSNSISPLINENDENDEKENSMQVTEESQKENLFHVTSSGIKIGDNWELPIIVLDSDDDENETGVIEVDSEEEEIQEFKKMMALDDVDCIEIGKDEFEKSKKDKKNDSEYTDDDTDDELFIPIVPGEGSVSKKRRYNDKLRPRPAKEQRTTSNFDFTKSDLNLFSLVVDDPSQWRKDLLPFPYITNHVLRVWATGYLLYRKEWERLEYLGDKVLMFCVLRFATAKYLQFYTPREIKIATTLLVSNKLLAAYSLTLGLDRQNQMQEGLNKRVADAFEAYIGAYYLSDGEEATTRYLEQLMSPLFELVLKNIQIWRKPHKIMGLIGSYFHMTFLTRVPKLK